MKRSIGLFIVMITVIMVVFLSQNYQSSTTYAQSAYPLPESSVSSLPPVPYPAPVGDTKPTPITTEEVVTVRISIDVIVDGLEGKDTVELQMIPDTEKTASNLQALGATLPIASFQNESRRIDTTAIPIGTYKLMISAPTSYFREPQGYLFQVTESGLVNNSGASFHFKLIPPSAQDLPPCRDFSLQQPDNTASESKSPDTVFKGKSVCHAKYIIDLSAQPKHPEPREQRDNSVLSVGYHYIGPKTTQSTKGILGRNFVVDPGVIHGGAYQFIAERVYAANDANWIEAGWAEVSWRDDRQYIYQMDSMTQSWHFYDQYALSTGTAVKTLVQSDGNNYWIAELYWDGSYHRLARENIGFDTTNNGYNRGETYTADGVHPSLPMSLFDMGYLNLTGGSIWNVWDTSYPTTVNEDDPYICDMIYRYDRFTIHSPLIFLPLVIKD